MTNMKNTRINIIARICSLAVALLCSGVNALADEGVVLTLKDGQELRFMFSEKPTVIHGRELTIIASDATTVSYDYTQVRSLRFGEFVPTAIEEVEGDSAPVVSFKIVDGTLYVYGLPAGERVSVYTISGQRVGAKRQSDNGVVLSLPLTSRGVLIVTTSTGISYRVLNP